MYNEILLNLPVVGFYTVAKVLIVDCMVLVAVPNQFVDHHRATDAADVTVVVVVHHVVVVADRLVQLVRQEAGDLQPHSVVVAVIAEVVAAVVAVAVDHNYSYICAVAAVADGKIATMNSMLVSDLVVVVREYIAVEVGDLENLYHRAHQPGQIVVVYRLAVVVALVSDHIDRDPWQDHHDGNAHTWDDVRQP